MKVRDLKEKTDHELQAMLPVEHERLRTFRFDIATKQIKNNQEYRNTKRLIARIHTILTERATDAKVA